MLQKIRHILWRILGFDYRMLLNKTDYVLLKNDLYTQKGKGTYDNGAKVWRWTNTNLIIGKFCSIAYDVNFIVDEGFHKSSKITSYPFINDKNKSQYKLEIIQKEGINVGNDVWIGMGAFIIPGVCIGNGVTIAANTVVTQDIPDYVVVAGSPGKIIKHKMSDHQKILMNKIAWWNWSTDQIEKMKLDFYELNIDEFIKKYMNVRD